MFNLDFRLNPIFKESKGFVSIEYYMLSWNELSAKSYVPEVKLFNHISVEKLKNIELDGIIINLKSFNLKTFKTLTEITSISPPKGFNDELFRLAEKSRVIFSNNLSIWVVEVGDGCNLFFDNY